jgi:hypothetical protein
VSVPNVRPGDRVSILQDGKPLRDGKELLIFQVLSVNPVGVWVRINDRLRLVPWDAVTMPW